MQKAIKDTHDRLMEEGEDRWDRLTGVVLAFLCVAASLSESPLCLCKKGNLFSKVATFLRAGLCCSVNLPCDTTI